VLSSALLISGAPHSKEIETMNTPHSNGAESDPTERTTTVRVDIRNISTAQLAQLGVSQVAYVKPVLMNGARAYAIHAADGEPMAVAGDQDLAVAAILQHEMAAALVH
jgi:hypothetical protein